MRNYNIKYFLLFFVIISGYSFAGADINKLEYSIYSDTIEINYINKDIAALLFNFIKEKINFIQYEDNNNCDLRAHLISVILEKKFHNLKLGKVWLFADTKRASRKNYYGDNNYSNLAIKTKGVNWGYHVAPCIIIDKDTIVIDPATQNTAVMISRWAKDLLPIDTKGFLILKDIKYFSFPIDDDGKYLDYSLSWDDNENESENLDAYTDMAEKMATAYHGFLDPSMIMFYKNKIIEICEE